jgi:ABC-type uncharacterized transport system YnjBCD permease subunit
VEVMVVAMVGALNRREETNWILLALFKRIIRMAFLQVIMFSTSEIENVSILFFSSPSKALAILCNKPSNLLLIC